MDLRPEESIGYEIGVRYTTSIHRSMRVTFDLVGFQNDYKNLIEPKFRRQIIAFQFLNLTQANIKGIESTIDASDISGKYNFTIGYTFLDHEDVNTKEPLSYRSDHQLIAGGSLSLFKHFQVGLDYQYLSEPEKVDTDFSIFIQDASESNDKHVIDLRFSSKLNQLFFKNNDQGDATLTLKVMNLLNYYYIERPAYMARPRMFEMSVQVRL
jgi:iron complex outermembrane receptor protein